MSLYSSIAPIYDKVNSDVDYSQWADFIEGCFEQYLKAKPELVLDLACGTGSMTVELARRGYDMTGVDLSVEMLGEARDKIARAGLDGVLLLNQNMTALDLYGTVGAAVCCMDALNYLTGNGELDKCLALVHNFLDPDGLFIFDVNTPYKFAQIYGDKTYVFDEGGGGAERFCVWENDFNADAGICAFELNVFTKCRDGRYTRSTEVQYERAYDTDALKHALTQAGFELLAVTPDFMHSPLSATDERLYFIARAKK